MKQRIFHLLEILHLRDSATRLNNIIGKQREALKDRIRGAKVRRLIKRRQRSGVFAVNICNIQGLGAKLECVLELLAYCDEKKLQPRFRFSSPGSKDYFNDYFFIKGAPAEEKGLRFTTFKTMKDLGLDKDYDKSLSIEYATRLINTYLGIKRHVLTEVADFQETHFRGRHVLGVHYRSTDKNAEAPTVSFETVKRNIEYYISQYPETEAVFISTDNRLFFGYLTKNFSSRQLITREDYFRSDSQSSIHHNKSLNKYEVNRDALVNCLLLSRCNALLKSSSFFSDWSKLFNPSIPVIMLNKPYEHKLWFPASAIMKEVLYQPV